MTRHSLTIAIALGLASVAPTPVEGQRQPATIPTVLATSLLGGYGEAIGVSPRFVVGRPPDGWPAALTPAAPVRVTGGVTFGPFRSAVFAYPRSSDVRAAYGALLRQAGYRRPDSLRMRRAGGFSGGAAQEGAEAYCGDSAVATMALLDSAQAPRSLVVTIVSDRGAAQQCGDDGSPFRGAGFTTPLRLPPLRAPRGVTTEPGGTSSSGDSFETTAVLDTTLSADSVLAHYSAELVAGGWRLLATPARADGFAARQLLAHDDKGDEWRGALIVLTGLGRREVLVRMARPREW